MDIVPVILAGGSGSRLWPVSRRAYPKQLLPLMGSQTMLQETILRTQQISNIAKPLVICHQEHRFLVAEQLHAIGIDDATIILEPISKNTAPATAIAALYHEKDDPLLLVLPADHFIKDANRFAEIVNEAVIHAKSHYLVTFGVIPTKPETGYGYIKIAKSIGNAECLCFALHAISQNLNYMRLRWSKCVKEICLILQKIWTLSD